MKTQLADQLDYQNQILRIHASTFGGYEMKDDLNAREDCCKTTETLPILKSPPLPSLKRTICSELREKCRSLPLDLQDGTGDNNSLMRFDSLSSITGNKIERMPTSSNKIEKHDCNMGITKRNYKENQKNVNRVEDKRNHKDKILWNSLRGNSVRKGIKTSPSDNMDGKKCRGYFYESVGGVYYAFGSSGSDEKLNDDDANYSATDTQCAGAFSHENIKNRMASYNNNSTKILKSQNLTVLSENSDRSDMDSGRQSCPSPITNDESSNNESVKHIYAIAKCVANVASLPGMVYIVYAYV